MWLRFVKAGVRLVEWQTTMLLMPTLYKDNRTKSKRPTRRYNMVKSELYSNLKQAIDMLDGLLIPEGSKELSYWGSEEDELNQRASAGF